MRWFNNRIFNKITFNNKTFKIKFLTIFLTSHKTKIGCLRNLVLGSTEVMTNSKILETQKKIKTEINIILPIIQIRIMILTNKWHLAGNLLKHKLLAQIAILYSGCRLLILSTSKGDGMVTQLRRPLSFLELNLRNLKKLRFKCLKEFIPLVKLEGKISIQLPIPRDSTWSGLVSSSPIGMRLLSLLIKELLGKLSNV